MDNNNTNSSPRVIYIAESPERAINYKYFSGSKNLSPDVTVLNPEDVEDLASNSNLRLPDYYNRGEILVLHPNKKEYINAKEAEEILFNYSIEGMFEIAQMLGAEKIEYKNSATEVSERKINNETQGSCKTVEAEVYYSNEIKKSNEKNYCKEREFESSEFTREKWEAANRLAKEKGYSEDKGISSLIEARKPDKNPLKKENVKLKVSSEMEKIMDIAFSINNCGFFSIDNETKIATKIINRLTIEWEIRF